MGIIIPGSGRAELLAKQGIVLPSDGFVDKLRFNKDLERQSIEQIQGDERQRGKFEKFLAKVLRPTESALKKFFGSFSKCPHCGDVGDVAVQGPNDEELCIRCGGEL